MRKQLLEKDNGKTIISLVLYGYYIKWYLPFGLAIWNRHSTNPHCYYKHLVEISIGILCFRFQFQWWRKP